MSECVVKIFGRIEHIRQDGTSSAVPFGIYTMELLSEEHVRLSGEGLPTFELALSHVAAHLGMQMKIVSGRWP